MEETHLKPRFLSVGEFAFQDTSLPRRTQRTQPPKSYMTRIESDEKKPRVQRQVRLTLGRDTKKGGVTLQNSSRSLDGTDGFLSNTKIKHPFTPLENGYDFSNRSLNDGHARRMSSRVVRSPTLSRELSLRRFNPSIRIWGPPSGLDYNHFKVVGALMDWPDCCNSPQQYVISETSRGTPSPAFMPLPEKYSSNSLKQPVRAKYTSASAAVQKSPGKTLSNQRVAVKHDKQTVHPNPFQSKAVQQSSRNMQNLTRQHHINWMPGSTQLDRGLTRQAQMSQRQKSDCPFIVGMEGVTRKQDEKQMKNHTLKTQKSVKKPPEMTIERALNPLGQASEDTLISSAQYIQNQCFQRADARTMVHNLHGVKKLLQLLTNDSEEVHRAAAGALRNVIYQNNDNKKDVKDEDGLPIILSALENACDKETICQLAGLLWNLSSDDTIKELFKKNSLCIITKLILLPSSGMKAQERPKYEMMADPKAFLCATGCLRNLSSGSHNLRSDMRKCENLIDSLVFYAQETSGSRKPNDESTENCVCILQNLTYKAEEDFPSQTTKHQEETQDTTTKKTTWGCFPHQSAKLTKDTKDEERPERVHLPQDVQDPHGAELLWNKSVVRMYLSLVACSTRSMTRQAAIGALQNLTDGKGEISKSVADIIKEDKGIQEIKKVLGNDSELKKPALLLIRNLSCFPDLLHTIHQELLSNHPNMLSRLGINTSASDELIPILCRILVNLSKSDAKRAKQIICQTDVIHMLEKNHKGKVEQAVNELLYTLWSHKDLHKELKENNIKTPKGQIQQMRQKFVKFSNGDGEQKI